MTPTTTDQYQELTDQITEATGISLTTEHQFHPTRKWRFDYAIPDHKIAIEVEGKVWQQGRHTRGSGYIKDLEKYNAAVRLGWRVIRITSQQAKEPKGQRYIVNLLNDLLWK